MHTRGKVHHKDEHQPRHHNGISWANKTKAYQDWQQVQVATQPKGQDAEMPVIIPYFVVHHLPENRNKTAEKKEEEQYKHHV
mgnify:CR=1 FL=1